MTVVNIVEHSCPYPCHIHIRRALPLACLACQARVHHLFNEFLITSTSHHLPEHVSPCPGGHGFVFSGFIYRTHSSPDDRRLSAVGSTVTLFDVEHQVLTFSTVHPFLCHILLFSLISQELVHRRCIHDLSHIHDAFRVPAFFQLAHYLVSLFAKHHRDKLTSQPTVTMLSTQATSMFPHNACSLFGHQSEHPSALLRLDVNYWSEMQFTC